MESLRRSTVMIKTLVLFMAVLGLSACGVNQQSGSYDFETDMIRHVAAASYQAVVSMDGNLGHGTGVAVAKDAKYVYILTNYHVVNPALPGDVLGFYCHKGKFHNATLVRANKDADIALLRTESKIGTIPLADANNVLYEFQRVFAVGYPLSAGLTITEGRIMPGAGDYAYDIAHTAVIAPGNSGGPLIAFDPTDGRFEVIGINSAVGASQYGMATHIALAIGYPTTYETLLKDYFK